eukprot:4417972-Amphidinium_carterae.1
MLLIWTVGCLSDLIEFKPDSHAWNSTLICSRWVTYLQTCGNGVAGGLLGLWEVNFIVLVLEFQWLLASSWPHTNLPWSDGPFYRHPRQVVTKR